MSSSQGHWDDQQCTNELNAVCESDAARGKAGPYLLAKGEARYFELLHVHNESNAGESVGPILGLELEISNSTSTWKTRVSGTQSLSMEFFREIASSPTVSVAIGSTVNAQLTSACVGTCHFKYSKEATPTLIGVAPVEGRGGDIVTIFGTNFPFTAGDVSVGIGGATCDVISSNGSMIECVLSAKEAQAGIYPVRVRVDELGNAVSTSQTESVVNFTIKLIIDDFSPRNGSVLGGTILRVWGSGFSRFGPQNKITIGNVDCVPRTLKNRACRVSEFDSGHKCARTVSSWYGYTMVENAYATANSRAHAEWFDYSNTTYIECIIQDQPDAEPVPNGSSWPVKVALLSEADLVDEDAIIQKYTYRRSLELDYATRNLDCFVLLGWRIWNVGMKGKNSSYTRDCVLMNDDYEVVGIFGEFFYHHGSFVTSDANYSFALDATPIVELADTMGMAGQEITIVGRNLAAAVDEWNHNWYMDEFGFYQQPTTPVVMIGTSPSVLTFANDTVIRVLPTYNVHEVLHKLRVWVLGRGRAKGNLTFAYVNYIYDVTPNVGSIEGGTLLTITGSGFATTHTFYADTNSESMGSSVANYIVKLPSNTRCTIVSATDNRIGCVTDKLQDSMREGTTSQVEVEVSWNGEPYYFRCAMDNCSPPGCLRQATECNFAFSSGATPQLMLQNFSTHETKRYVAPGDTITFSIMPGSDANGTFNWSAIDESIFSVSLGAIPCNQVAFSLEKKTLQCIISESATPQGEESVVAIVHAAGYGYARISNNGGVVIRPVIEAISATHGSLAGGLKLSIFGRGFARQYVAAVFVAPATKCEHIIVHTSKFLTCMTPQVKATPSDWIVEGHIYLDVNSTASACKATPSCKFWFVGNSTASTPIVTNVSETKVMVRKGDSQQITILGRGFAKSGNLVFLGYQECLVVAESETVLTCTLPNHPAGLYPVTVTVPGKGKAAGFSLWIQFLLEVDATVVMGSLYGGQTITLKGSGFPTCAPDEYGFWRRNNPTLTCTDAAAAACKWMSYEDGKSIETVISAHSGEYFSATVISSTYSKMIVVSTLRGLDGHEANNDDGTLAIKVTPSTQTTSSVLTMSPSKIVATSLFNGGNQWRLFDSNYNKYWVVSWDGFRFATLTYDFGFAAAVGKYSFYISGDKSCQLSWILAASEDGVTWEEIDKFNYNSTRGTCSKIWRSSVIKEPGLYRFYQWRIEDLYLNSVNSPLKLGQLLLNAPESINTNASYVRSQAYTPTVIAVSPPKGGFRQIVGIRGNWDVDTLDLAGSLAVRIGGYPCPIHWANATYLECASPNASSHSVPVPIAFINFPFAQVGWDLPRNTHVVSFRSFRPCTPPHL